METHDSTVTYQSHDFAGPFQSTDGLLVRDIDSRHSVHRHYDVIHSVKPRKQTQLNNLMNKHVL